MRVLNIKIKTESAMARFFYSIQFLLKTLFPIEHFSHNKYVWKCN